MFSLLLFINSNFLSGAVFILFYICFILFSNRNLLASGSADSSVIVWDLTEGKVLNKLSFHSNKVSFANDGNKKFYCIAFKRKLFF